MVSELVSYGLFYSSLMEVSIWFRDNNEIIMG
jgi:hypothetical protein